MKTMDNLLYLLHVNWGWIKQRPHFLAEFLSYHFFVQVCFSKQYKKLNIIRNIHDTNLTLKELFKLPWFSQFEKLNSQIRKYQILKFIHDYDIIWVTHPYYFPDIDGVLTPNQRLVYDCMDDHINFPEIIANKALREKLHRYEKGLVKKSDIVFCSSQYLKDTLENRYSVNDNIFVINNAISPYLLNSKNSLDWSDDRFKTYFNSHFIRLVYIGTVSQWIDFDIILASLEKYKEIAYFFFGPYDGKLPEHDRIYYMGPVEHNCLYDIMQHANALIMPFQINELIKSVNPVKIYEYILGCKPSLIASYGESDIFGDFVYLYKSFDDYSNFIERLINNNLSLKQPREAYEKFAQENTWKQRTDEIIKLLKTLY
jgi:teichuronic acid biosynthesis glycosyltransferase TuaH